MIRCLVIVLLLITTAFRMVSLINKEPVRLFCICSLFCCMMQVKVWGAGAGTLPAGPIFLA